MYRRAIVLASLLLALPSIAQAWWNKDWAYRKQITIDTSATGAAVQGTLADMPVLVRLHTGNFAYFLDLENGGDDIRFIGADDKTPLKFHIEKFDAINQMALIWVKVPKIVGNSKDQHIWMYYGNQSAPAAQDAAGTYGVDQALVYHFSGKPGAPKDSTAYANDAAQSTAQPNPASLIGAGEQFAGNGLITIPAKPSLQVSDQSGWTFRAWVSIAASQNKAYLLDDSSDDGSFVVGIDGTSAYAQYTGNDGKTIRTPAGAQLAPGSWHQLAVTVGGGHITVFIDGVQASTVAANVPALDGNLTLGGSPDDSNYLTGKIDEVDIARTARSADWIKATYADEGMNGKLVSYGKDEGQEDSGAGGGNGSYFQIILQNVTVDGWVVICLCGIMGVISWLVMAIKGMAVTNERKHNRQFLRSYERLGADDTATLDRDDDEADQSTLVNLFGLQDDYRSSSLYRIYHRGIHEVQARVGPSVGASAVGLAPKAVSAVRAALDAVVVRETQRLNSLMVLLTIAISGGPFLGLLGTVVGVMITFASIAATGDVNINAIAPGIAAALMATIAGLGVAIPALFGYNYIGSRIKEVSADMQVFADEFVSRIAEHYGT